MAEIHQNEYLLECLALAPSCPPEEDFLLLVEVALLPHRTMAVGGAEDIVLKYIYATSLIQPGWMYSRIEAVRLLWRSCLYCSRLYYLENTVGIGDMKVRILCVYSLLRHNCRFLLFM